LGKLLAMVGVDGLLRPVLLVLSHYHEESIQAYRRLFEFAKKVQKIMLVGLRHGTSLNLVCLPHVTYFCTGPTAIRGVGVLSTCPASPGVGFD
jgi:hypothetical protein